MSDINLALESLMHVRAWRNAGKAISEDADKSQSEDLRVALWGFAVVMQAVATAYTNEANIAAIDELEKGDD